ncbi:MULTISPECIES: GNAT family N-acetyltransferase [Luteimonas]|uniref:GNAT family N-acetyltransferase n=1 Tax=Luteimonas TaxID=83614 RepID=UPI000C7DA98A|nr:MULTISPECIES: GNAT family N-acetyltransferase [Luteimonas]
MSLFPATFETTRYHMRPLAAADNARYCALYTDPAVMRLIAPPLSASAAQAAFDAVLRATSKVAPGVGYWTIDRRSDGHACGLMAVVLSPAPRTAEYGLLLQPASHARGVARETTAGLLDRLFASPALDRVWTRHTPDNVAVRGLMRALGFEPDAPRDGLLHWQMTRAAWLARGEMPPAFASRPGAG